MMTLLFDLVRWSFVCCFVVMSIRLAEAQLQLFLPTNDGHGHHRRATVGESIFCSHDWQVDEKFTLDQNVKIAYFPMKSHLRLCLQLNEALQYSTGLYSLCIQILNDAKHRST